MHRTLSQTYHDIDFLVDVATSSVAIQARTLLFHGNRRAHREGTGSTASRHPPF